jgi:hypothetical protein
VSKHSPTQEVNDFVAVQRRERPELRAHDKIAGRDLAFPRHIVPEFWLIIVPLKAEGAGKTGCQVHPQPPMQEKSIRVFTTGTPKQSGLPCAMV